MAAMALDCARETRRIASFIRRVVRDASAEGVVVGLSGGIDSAVTGALCVRALGRAKVIGLLMPSDHTPAEDMKDAEALARSWGIRTEEVPISKIAKGLVASAGADGSRVARANVEARVRMVILYYYANSLGYLVAGTGDRSEETLGYFCYDPLTRAVTTEGLKGMNELKAGDTVFSLDPSSCAMVEAKVDEVFKFDYDADLIHFRGRGVDLLVTPNHRMLVQASSSSPEDPAFFREAAECLRFKRILIPLATKWAGKEGLPLAIKLEFEQNQVRQNILIAIEDMMYLFGLFIGDGNATKGRVVTPVKSSLTQLEYSTAHRDKSGRFMLLSPDTFRPHMKEYPTYETYFALPDYTKEAAGKRLLEILNRYSIGYSLTRDVVRISSKAIYELFVQCGVGAHNKHIPRWLLDYPSVYLFWLLRGLKDSDATHTEDQNAYYTSSERLKDDFVELCYKIGRKATVSVRGPRQSKIRGKVVRTGPSFEICFAKKPRLQQALFNEHTCTASYSGKVWCPSVPPYENLLVERNGRYIVSGNTKGGDGQADFLPIAHLYKTQVRELGAHLGLPGSVVQKPASPQLWPGHRASDELPADYDKLDVALHCVFDLKKSPAEAASKAGLSRAVVDRVLEMHRRSEHKRKMPPSLA